MAGLLNDLGRIASSELESLQLGSARIEMKDRSAEQRKQRLDPVTGVWNRLGIVEILESSLVYCAKSGSSATILLVEVDENAQLRETWSSEGRDILLAELAQVLRSCLRDYDSIGRMGDERFAVALVGLSSQHAAQRIKAFKKKLDESVVLQSANVRMRFGFACVEPGGPSMSLDALLGIASESLTQASEVQQLRLAS
jgi:diguanylate cyclase (GGDEF)-like protein